MKKNPVQPARQEVSPSKTTANQKSSSGKPRIIDSHQHVFWHGRNDRELIADIDAAGIDLSWLLTWDIAPWEYVPGHNEWLNPLNRRADGTVAGVTLADVLLARDRYPQRFIAGYCPHPMSYEPCAALRTAVKMYQVKVCGEWKYRMPFDDPRCIELFRTAGELGLPIVLHLDYAWLPESKGRPTYRPYWYGGNHDNLERALQACPQTRFIGHAAGFWRGISADFDTNPEMYPKSPVTGPGVIQRLFDRYENLSADLSAGSGLGALRRSPEFSRKFLCDYSKRLLFGRDCYGTELLDALTAMDLPPAVSAAILGGNAQRLIPS